MKAYKIRTVIAVTRWIDADSEENACESVSDTLKTIVVTVSNVESKDVEIVESEILGKEEITDV